MKRIVAGLFVIALGLTPLTVHTPAAEAHQSGCHAAHTCPSDTGSYVWEPGSSDPTNNYNPSYVPPRRTPLPRLTPRPVPVPQVDRRPV